MSSAAEVPLTKFGRRQTKGLLLGFSTPRVLALGCAAASVAVGMLAGPLFLLLVAAVLVAVSFVPWHGAPAVEAVGFMAHWGARRATGQTRHRVKVEQPRPVGTMALPGDAAALRYLEITPGVVAIHDPHANTLTAVCEVSYSAFVLLDPYAQQRRVTAWGRVQAAQAALGRTSVIQVLETVIPDPGRGVAGWWESNGVHDGSWPAVQYEELMTKQAPSSSTHRTLIAFGLDMKQAKDEIKRAGRGVKGAAAVLATDADHVQQALRRADLTIEGWLGERELAAFIRGAYDPAVDLDPTQPGASLAVAGPMAIDEHFDHLVHDSGASQVLWITDWPRSEAVPNFMHQSIFETGVRRTLSLFMRPVPTHKAVKAVRAEKTDYLADRDHKRRIGQTASEADDDEYRDVVARERALNAGHADMRYTGLLVVTAATPDEVRTAGDKIRRSAHACGLETQILYGRQAQGFTAAALPLGRVIS